MIMNDDDGGGGETYFHTIRAKLRDNVNEVFNIFLVSILMPCFEIALSEID